MFESLGCFVSTNLRTFLFIAFGEKDKNDFFLLLTLYLCVVFLSVIVKWSAFEPQEQNKPEKLVQLTGEEKKTCCAH